MDRYTHEAEVRETLAAVFEISVQPPKVYPLQPVTSMPVLCLEVDGNLVFPEEAFHWARSQLTKIAPKRLRRAVNVLGRLYEFWARYPNFEFEVSTDVDLLIWNYLFLRLHSPSNIAKRPFPHWEAVTYEVAADELRLIALFARYCQKHYANRGSPLGRAFSNDSDVFQLAAKKRPENDFYSHLSIQRENWEAIIGFDPVFPRELKQIKGSKVRRSAPRTKTPTLAETGAIIANEGNYLFRALWLLLFGTGIRISEGLNLWTCDILPSSYSSEFTGHENAGEPLILLCHPERSTYTGSIAESHGSYTRTDKLESLGMRPRTAFDIGPAAGWKSPVLSDPDRRLSWAFWTNDAYAREFDRLIGKILQLHRSAPSESRGPFFFCNSAAHTPYYGNYLRYKNASRAFQLACHRSGLSGYTLHSARHHYKWVCDKVLGLSSSEIQIFMHHKSIESQEVYGRAEIAAYERLKSALGARRDH
ncbi:hypothetical protein ASE23_12960 [Rhizobium sp. Root73]|uniref:hypothetical protein n=1 Tax=unclassified Rhizobium TaxID=2613769 RepID=UPI00072A71BD|nr:MULTISPECIES: hypothetical protein [unclassified Rhizobium]KQY03701.1 hypothetical protein ASD36_15160 [Rhizobium sp. Root1334]KRC00341.1 hypothetical protein ASE23_12960 [Rhizobium sp. Root73]